MASSPTPMDALIMDPSYLLALAQVQAQAQAQQRARESNIQDGIQRLFLQALVSKASAPAHTAASTAAPFTLSSLTSQIQATAAPQAQEAQVHAANASSSTSDLLTALILKNRAEVRTVTPSPVAAPSDLQGMDVTTDRIQQIATLLRTEEEQANRDLQARASAATPPPPTLSPSTLALCQRMGVAVPPQFVAAPSIEDAEGGFLQALRSAVSTRSLESTCTITHQVSVRNSPGPTQQQAKPSASSNDDDDDDAPRKGRAIEFPKTLHMMLRSLEATGQGHIASYTPDGTGFVIRKPQEFANQALDRYCTSSNYASFQRQVNLYCFQRTKMGVENVYSHPMFHRDQPELCLGMVRTKIKNSKLRNKKNAL